MIGDTYKRKFSTNQPSDFSPLVIRSGVAAEIWNGDRLTGKGLRKSDRKAVVIGLLPHETQSRLK